MYYVFRERLFVVKDKQLTDVVTKGHFTAAYTRAVLDPNYDYPAKPIKEINGWLTNKLKSLESSLEQNKQRLIYASGEGRFQVRRCIERLEKDIQVYSSLIEE